MKRLFLGILLSAGIVGVASAASLAYGDSATQSRAAVNPVALNGDLRLADAAAFDEYALFAPGPGFDGTPLAAITRRRDKPDPTLPPDARPSEANWVNFIYTDGCVPATFGLDCKSMAQVQVWPACERNLTVYGPALKAGNLHLELLEVRGVPAAMFDQGEMLEIYSGKSTIVLFAADRTRLLALADQLVSINSAAVGAAQTRRADTLPAPVSGAMEGKLTCSPPV